MCGDYKDTYCAQHQLSLGYKRRGPPGGGGVDHGVVVSDKREEGCLHDAAQKGKDKFTFLFIRTCSHCHQGFLAFSSVKKNSLSSQSPPKVLQPVVIPGAI